MITRFEILKDSFLQKNYEKSINELNDFFGFKWVKNKPILVIVPDRKTIDEIKGFKTENWIIGWSKEKDIYILDRKNFEKESCHKYSDEKYIASIKHELCHSFSSVLSKENDNPIWLTEGVAIYLSGQTRFKKIPAKFKSFLKYYNDSGKEVYDESGFAVKLLVENFGKKRLLKLIKSLNKIDSKKAFNTEFEAIYKFKPNYKNFNKLMKNEI